MPGAPCSKMDPEQVRGRRTRHFLRVKSTLTTLEPSSLGSSLPRCPQERRSRPPHAPRAGSSAPSAWKVSANSTAGSWNWVTAANGTMKCRRNAAERQPDGKAVLLDLQIPEAVLDDDRHLVGEALQQMLGDGNSRHPGLERDIEMMLAGQPARSLRPRRSTRPTTARSASCTISSYGIRLSGVSSLIGSW